MLLAVAPVIVTVTFGVKSLWHQRAHSAFLSVTVQCNVEPRRASNTDGCAMRVSYSLRRRACNDGHVCQPENESEEDTDTISLLIGLSHLTVDISYNWQEKVESD